MLKFCLLLLVTSYICSGEGHGECTDLRGHLISHGLHYVPGPDTCTLCICDNGSPKICKAVLCSPPQDCRSFRVGNTCCDFICLDDVVKPVESADSNVRAAAGGAAAVVLVTAALLLYRARRHKRRRNRTEHHRSLTSIGYISGSMGYMSGACETALAAWKPGQLPRGEAPPPYDEAVAQCRLDNARSSNDGFHRSFPGVEPPPDFRCHTYVNVPRPMHQMANPQGCYNAPLLQPPHALDIRDPNIAHHPLAFTASGNFPGFGGRLTGSLGAIAARHPHYPHHSHPNTQHRTIPRISTATDTTILDTSLSVFNRGDRSLHGEIRRSFHKPNEARHLSETGRSMPRNLNIVSSAEIIRHPEPVVNVPNPRVNSSTAERARLESDAPRPPSPPQPDTSSTAGQTLPLTVDKPSCVCSYNGAGAPGGDEHDDYRNECENCKAANSSRWAVVGLYPDAAGTDCPEEESSRTLERRPANPAPPAITPATLPTAHNKNKGNIISPPSNWENWFSTIPDSDTESEEE